MSPKKIRWLVICLFAILGAAGCKCNNLAVEDFVIFADSPALNLVVSTLNPTFSWTANKSCDPDEYDLHIREDVMYGGDSANGDVIYDDVPYTLTGDSLLPGRAYYWYARARNDYTSSEDPGASGPFSDYAYFFTGPVCSGETLIAPELQFPRQYGGNPDTDNWITHNHLQEFNWTYTGGCLPLSYDFQFATDAGFTDIVMTGTTTTPHFQSIFESFPNCSTLFWRVAANDGTTVGPWSPSWNFHWVREGTECYQTHYLSDDFAWIHVRLAEDLCDQTGFMAAQTQTLNPGCMVDGTIIVGDNSSVIDLDNFVVDLGAGPCPSTGLDQKTAVSTEARFGLLTPGTYCFSISRNQSIGVNNQINLMGGIWTNPRVNAVVAERTIDLGPGWGDENLQFNWDEYDLALVLPEFDFTMECRFCPDPIGPVTGFLFAEIPVLIFGRDYSSNWKLSEVEGKLCYALISDALIDEALQKLGGLEMRSADLDQFPPPPPCPEPDNLASGPKTCSDYKTVEVCRLHVADGCKWIFNTTHCDGP